MSAHVAIIGAYGSAGVATAERLADDSETRLTLVDDGDPGGGLCILRGCMPSKEVLSAAEHRFAARHDPRLAGPAPEVAIAKVVESKNEHTANFARHRRAAVERLAEADDVEFYPETARFVGDRSLRIGNQTLEPDYVVIATGSTVNLPSMPGMTDVPVMTSEDVLDADEFGDSGVVMGFGYIGLELVPYLSEAAGLELTVIEHDDRPLDEADPRFGETLLEYYRDEFGVTVLTNAQEQRVERMDDGGIRLIVERGGYRERIEADHLFAFTGRSPAVEGLGLDSTSLRLEQGWVEETMQARDDDHVFVVGDVNGKEPILHVAKEQGFVAAENIRRHQAGQSLVQYEPLHHHVVFSGLGILPFARIGESATSAEQAGLEHLVVTREASSDGVFTTKNFDDGLARLVIGSDGSVLGYQGLHYHADVMAKTMQVIIDLGLDVRELPERAYHPTTPEILDGLFREGAQALA